MDLLVISKAMNVKPSYLDKRFNVQEQRKISQVREERMSLLISPSTLPLPQVQAGEDAVHPRRRRGAGERSGEEDHAGLC